MPAQTGATTTQSSPLPTLAIIVALAIERVCVRAELDGDHGANVVLYQSGPGPERAAEAARAAVRDGAAGLVSWGVAGGLEPRVQPGTVVVPNRIVMPTGESLRTDPRWRIRIVEALQPDLAIDEGALLAAERVIETPQLKASAAADTGAVAVDMESGAIAAVAAETDLPVVAIRVVADAASDTLPPNIGQWIDPSGRRRLTPIFGAAVKPKQWSMLAVLARRHRVAQHALTALAHRLVPKRFEFAPEP